jgi:hypothetical protein
LDPARHAASGPQRVLGGEADRRADEFGRASSVQVDSAGSVTTRSTPELVGTAGLLGGVDDVVERASRRTR